MDGDYFLYCVKEYIVPMLDNYQRGGEPRSVVMMDNASMHMSDKIQAAIEDSGAVLIYGAPFSPNLNPIENYSSVYKKYITRNGERIKDDWRAVHYEVLNKVDKIIGGNHFRSCGIPGS